MLTPPGVKDRVRNYTRERRIDRLTCVESMYIHKRYPCVYNSRMVDRQSTEWNTPSLQSVPMPNNPRPANNNRPTLAFFFAHIVHARLTSLRLTGTTGRALPSAV